MDAVCVECRTVYTAEASGASPYGFEFCSSACQEASARAELEADERDADEAGGSP